MLQQVREAPAGATTDLDALPLALATDDTIQIRADNSADWSAPAPVFAQGTSPVQIVAADWYDTGAVSTGLTVAMPSGLQDGDLVAFIGIAANNYDGIWSTPGASVKPDYYARVPNRIIQKISETDGLRRISMNTSWGFYNAATWAASYDKMAMLVYTSCCVLALRGATSLSLEAVGQRSVVSPAPDTVTRTFDYPALSCPVGARVIDIATARFGTGGDPQGSPASLFTMLQWVNPKRLDETVMKNWRYSTHVHTTTHRVAKTPVIPAETREFPGYSYVQTAVMRLVASP